jgi:hypothetical protein
MVHTIVYTNPMKQYSIKFLNANLSKCLDQLPFEITRYNLPYARVISVDEKPKIEELKEVIKKIEGTHKGTNKFIPAGTKCRHGILYHEGCHY